MQRLAREREKLRVVRDQMGCPTWSRMIAETTALALKQVTGCSERSKFNGAYHLAASGLTSWHGFASRIIEWMPEADRKCREVEGITTAEYPTPAKRPAYSGLDCAKLQKTFGLQLPHWEASLRQVLDKP
jgi:dTDP-4-dehydrorhamnose reductase